MSTKDFLRSGLDLAIAVRSTMQRQQPRQQHRLHLRWKCCFDGLIDSATVCRQTYIYVCVILLWHLHQNMTTLLPKNARETSNEMRYDEYDSSWLSCCAWFVGASYLKVYNFYLTPHLNKRQWICSSDDDKNNWFIGTWWVFYAKGVQCCNKFLWWFPSSSN